MAIEQSGQPAFSTYPAGAGTTGPIRPIDTTTQRTRVTLTGTDYTVLVQISNAQSTTTPLHLFVPPSTSFQTYRTATPTTGPIDIPNPARWVRCIVTSGSVTGGTIEQSNNAVPVTSDIDPARVDSAVALATQASDAVGRLQRAALDALPKTQGPQFVDGSRWVPSTTNPYGTPGLIGLVRNAADGGYWVRELTAPAVRPEWFTEANDPDDTNSLERALATGLWLLLGIREYQASRTLYIRYGQRIVGVSPSDSSYAALNRFNSRIAFYALTPGATGIVCGADTSNQAKAAALGTPIIDVDIAGPGRDKNCTAMLVEGYLQVPMRCKVHSWSVGVRMQGPHMFMITLDSMHITDCTQAAQFVGGTDTGEKIALQNCVLNNNDYHLVFYGRVFVTTYNTSLDYAALAPVLIAYRPVALDQCGSLTMFGGHIENDYPVVRKFIEMIEGTGQTYWPAILLSGVRLFKALGTGSLTSAADWISPNVGWTSIILNGTLNQNEEVGLTTVSSWPEPTNYPNSGEPVENYAASGRRYTLLYPFTLTPTGSAEAYVNLSMGRSAGALSLVGQWQAPAGSTARKMIVSVTLPCGWFFKLDYLNATLDNLGTRVLE